MRNTTDLKFVLLFILTTSLWVIIFAAVIVPLIAGLLPIGSPLRDAFGTEFLQTFSWLDDFTTIVVLIVAGVITAANVITRRPLNPHISVSHRTDHRILGGRKVHMSVEASLHNRSNVPVKIRRASVTVERLVPMPDGHYQHQSMVGAVGRGNIKKFAPQEALCNRRFELDQYDVVIEAGQIRQETIEIVIEPRTTPLRVQTQFTGGLPKAPKESDTTWKATSFVDISGLSVNLGVD